MEFPLRQAQGERGLAFLLLFLSATASAHPVGFHTKVALNVSLYAVEGLVVMTLDGGERCELLKRGADLNHDGVLSLNERTALKDRMTQQAIRALKLSFGGFPVPVEVKGSKLDLHEDAGVSPTSIGVAVLLEMKHPHTVTPGMSLVLEDSAPDFSTIDWEVNQLPALDAGAIAPVRQTTPSAEKLTIRLGWLAPR